MIKIKDNNTSIGFLNRNLVKNIFMDGEPFHVDLMEKALSHENYIYTNSNSNVSNDYVRILINHHNLCVKFYLLLILGGYPKVRRRRAKQMDSG